MKKLLAFLMVVAMLIPCALAEPRTIDLETMTLDELTELKSDVSAAILNLTVENIDGYNVISDYSEYARNPEIHKGEMIRFDGEIVQVVEGIEQNIYRISFNSDANSMFYVTYTPGIESERILEDDQVTVFGEFNGLYTYTSTLGGEITIPYCVAENITSKIEEVGAYAAMRQDPAPIGATVRYNGESYSNPAVTDLTVTSVIRGDAAWSMVREFNRYNDAPTANQEYIIVSVHANAISSTNDQQAELSDYQFVFVSASGVEYKDSYTSGITPELTNLYPGAECEGVIVGLIDKGDEPLMVYLKDSDRPIWFDLNKRAPIELPDDVVLNPLQKGDKNDEVKQMQTMLVEMGYLQGTPDGSFGSKTESAVKTYQEAMGLESTGIADVETLRLILTATMPE